MTAIGSDFVKQIYCRSVRCGECGQKFPAGFTWLVSIRNGRIQKRVCGEECRLEFDNRYWQGVAAARRMVTK